MSEKFNIPLINTHTHAGMLGMRGMGNDLNLDEWLNDYVWPYEKDNTDENEVYLQTKKAIQEMKDNLISVFVDMYFYPYAAAQAIEEEQVVGYIGFPVMNFPVPGISSPSDAFEKYEGFIQKYKDSKFVKPIINVHSIYIVDEEYLIQAKKLADKYGLLYHIHVSETKKEVDECNQKHGCSPVQYLDKLGILDERCLMVHCVHVDYEDIKTIARTGASVVHCSLSNLKLGSGIAPIWDMLQLGINVCLGTDGPASSDRLDIIEAGKFAGLLQKGLHQEPTVMPIKQVVKMMSVNGMKALGIDKLNGLTIQEIEQRIENEDYSFLYFKNISELK